MRKEEAKMIGGLSMRTAYFKPNMNNLKGKLGRSILDEIRTAKKPNLDHVKKEADECIERILARRTNEK